MKLLYGLVAYHKIRCQDLQVIHSHRITVHNKCPFNRLVKLLVDFFESKSGLAGKRDVAFYIQSWDFGKYLLEVQE